MIGYVRDNWYEWVERCRWCDDVLTCCPAAIGRSSKLFSLVVIADIDDCSARTTSTSGSISGLVSGMTRSVGGRKFQPGVVVTAGCGGCR